MKKNSLAYYAYIQDHPFLFFTKLPKIHFTQLYEIIVVLIALCIGYICFFKIRKQPIDGIPAICFGLVLTLGRFVVYFFREFPDASQTSNIIRGPVTYVLALLLLLILLIGRIRIVRRLSLTSVKIESLGNKYFNEEKFEYYENS